MLTMSTLMMPTTMTTMTNPGPIPTHTLPQQKLEPPKMQQQVQQIQQQQSPNMTHLGGQIVNVNKSGVCLHFLFKKRNSKKNSKIK